MLNPISYDFTLFETAWGPMAFACRGELIIELILPRLDEESIRGELHDKLAPATINFQKNLLPQLQQELKNYFAGRQTTFTGKLDFSSTGAFALRALQACAKIPAGATITYGALAARAGNPRAARAAGGVMARNRVPLLVPCHRVIAADGALRGFSANGGLALKKRMLDHEKRMIQPAKNFSLSIPA